MWIRRIWKKEEGDGGQGVVRYYTCSGLRGAGRLRLSDPSFKLRSIGKCPHHQHHLMISDRMQMAITLGGTRAANPPSVCKDKQAMPRSSLTRCQGFH